MILKRKTIFCKIDVKNSIFCSKMFLLFALQMTSIYIENINIEKLYDVFW